VARLCTRLGDAEFRDSDAGKHEYEAEQDEENSSGQVDVCDYSAVGDPGGSNVQSFSDNT